MDTMTSPPGTVTGGVDTYSDVHVAAALDHLGGVLGTAQFRTTWCTRSASRAPAATAPRSPATR